jgi:tyrosine-protein phosphatase SIW14
MSTTTPSDIELSPPKPLSNRSPPTISTLPQTTNITTTTSTSTLPPPPLIPPENFSLVFPGVFRSSFPKRKNFPFLQSLGLKTVLTLVLEEYPSLNRNFLSTNGIHFLQFGVAGNKEPFAELDEAVIREALHVPLDVRNLPLLIHCNKGKHRTGCFVACLRKSCGWALVPTLEEYTRFAGSKPRFTDTQFIEFFDPIRRNSLLLDEQYLPEWADLKSDSDEDCFTDSEDEIIMEEEDDE